MKLKKLLAMVISVAMILGTMSIAAYADDATVDVAVGVGQTYTTLAEAVANATDVNNDGAITVGIYGKLEIGAMFQLNIACKTVNIVGMTNDAEIYVNAAPAENGVVYVANNAIEVLNFKNLKLSRPNGEWRGNEGHHNCFFTVWDNDGSADITYTNCVFPNGAGNNQYGKTTYTDCTFNNDVYYALWIYGSGDKGVVEVTGCTFDADRGVKIYSEDASATVSTTITDSTFAIDSKPAIVSSIAGELVVEDVDATACEYGLLASEPKDGRSDLESAEITVDGEEPEFVAKVGNMVCTDMDYAVAESSTTKPISKLIAIYNGTRYYDLQPLVDAVGAGETIELLDDTEVSSTVVINKNLTINGNGFTVKGADVTETETNGTAVTPIEVNGATVNFNNITVKGGNAYNNDPYQPTASHGVAGAAIKAVNAKINIDNSTIAGGDAGAEFTKSTGSAIVSEDSDIVATNSTLATGRTTRSNVVGVATVYLDATSTIDLTDVVIDTAKSTYASDNVIASISDNGQDTTKYTGEVNLDGEITVLGTRLANVNVVAGENLTFKGNIDASYIANTLTVEYVKKDVDDENKDNDENADLYDIVIKGNKQFINRLTTVDLTFDLTSTTAVAPTYEIISVAPVTVTENLDYEDRYMFSFDGITQPDETAQAIVIGQVKITGYGDYVFAVDTAPTTNIAHATKTSNSIVEEFTPNGDVNAGEGKFDIETNKIDAEIKVPTRELEIVINFPNSVEKKAEDYQDMTVTVSGGDLAEAIEIELGKDDKTVAVDNEYEKDDAKYTVEVGDSYVITLTDVLAVNNSYTVTVEGAGYRTARYTVTMTDDKELTFWNNVMDEEKVIETNKDSSKVTKNFLAGDIVKDNNINIYDLSAVVSYFGEGSNVANGYAKYDLNRDGVIDSKDVAYVLVSWNN